MLWGITSSVCLDTQYEIAFSVVVLLSETFTRLASLLRKGSKVFEGGESLLSNASAGAGYWKGDDGIRVCACTQLAIMNIRTEPLRRREQLCRNSEVENGIILCNIDRRDNLTTWWPVTSLGR